MKIQRITDENDDRLNLFYRVNENQLKNIYAPEPGIFIAESELVIDRALSAGYIPESFLVEEGKINDFQAVYEKCSDEFTVYEVKKEIFEKFKGYILLRGILGIFKRKCLPELSEILKDAKRIVVLENVENPTNVGAIFRNAAGLFADGILLTDDSCDPLYRRSLRVSMGNIFEMPWTFIDKNDYIERLHEYGFKTVALALREDSVDIDDEKLNSEDKLAIILGSEGYGMSSQTIEKADYVVKIKMNPKVDSLNVASASGIALWQLCRKKSL